MPLFGPQYLNLNLVVDTGGSEPFRMTIGMAPFPLLAVVALSSLLLLLLLLLLAVVQPFGIMCIRIGMTLFSSFFSFFGVVVVVAHLFFWRIEGYLPLSYK
jgi:hypothetical protein